MKIIGSAGVAFVVVIGVGLATKNPAAGFFIGVGIYWALLFFMPTR